MICHNHAALAIIYFFKQKCQQETDVQQIMLRGEWVPGRGRSVQRSHRCRMRPDGETEYSSLFHTWHRRDETTGQFVLKTTTSQKRPCCPGQKPACELCIKAWCFIFPQKHVLLIWGVVQECIKRHFRTARKIYSIIVFCYEIRGDIYKQNYIIYKNTKS